MKRNWKNGYCDRCGEKSDTFKGSYFNEDMCCDKCISIEKQHKDFKKAKEIEHKEVLQGNYNFKGIGLPDDIPRSR